MSSLISATNEAPLALIMLLIIITSQEQLPLAPYSLKLYCRMGAMDSKEANVTKLCPTASTACGYLEFSDPNVSRRTISSGNENSVGIYECVDSSIFMTENEDNENAKQVNKDMFARFCDHRARCRIMSAGWLNGQFLQYLTKVRRVDGTRARSSAIVKFCCAINDALLDEVIRSGLNEPYMDEVIRVRPAQLKFDDDYEDVTREDGSDKDPQAYNERSSYYYYDERSEYIAEYHCVQRHFNDELYRYCVLVHSNKSPSHCFEGHGYRICCCFFTSGEWMRFIYSIN
ncbi:unnamed protein product [Anisakis simplex]|uniref:Uncharacterized protein n=1 Tax=Anisakis simplex TaxID=6269 RepID=A0A0M3JW96_ANISI|nr:unnamed protein product [Anisakis simplex]